MLQHMDQHLPHVHHMLHQHTVTVTVINIEKKKPIQKEFDYSLLPLLSTTVPFIFVLFNFQSNRKMLPTEKKIPHIQFVEVENLVKKSFLISNFHLQYILYLCIPSNFISTSFFLKPYTRKHNYNSTQNMTRFSSQEMKMLIQIIFNSGLMFFFLLKMLI